MGRTLFWYIFRDLVKIFLMANGALAGIMSFGGLLRPLTQQGLDASQVGRMLTYFTPAMTTYSVPVAALFATTVVYGRLSADNELTGCRSGGISNLWIAWPALVLGLIVAILSALFMFFIVPSFTYKVEQVVYSNLAKIIASKIERQHKIDFGRVTIFAQGAYLPPNTDPAQQVVVLMSPAITTFERPDKSQRKYMVPKDFYMATDATVRISRTNSDQEVRFTVALHNGTKFPRDVGKGPQLGVEALQYGPIVQPSPIREDVKYMDVLQLKQVYEHPESSRGIRELVDNFRSQDQSMQYVHEVRDALNSAARQAEFSGVEDQYALSLDGPARAIEKAGELLVEVDAADPARHVHLRREGRGQMFSLDARSIRMTADADGALHLMDLSLDLSDVLMQTPDGPVPRREISYPIKTPMPASVRTIESRGPAYYLSPAAAGTGNQRQLQHALVVLENEIRGESHSRASFAISCLILVLLGCALGMMFRSGDFLTAFAVSFIPALLSITLIISGMGMCKSVPWDYPIHPNPIRLGLGLIWSGNAINLALACVLLGRLQRQ